MARPQKSRQGTLYLSLSQMSRLINDNRVAIATENVKIVQACNIVVAFTMLSCIVAAFLIRQYHVVPAYTMTILVMLIEYFFCRSSMKTKEPYRYEKLLLYVFSIAVLGFASYLVFFVKPSATYISFIGFLVLLSMLFIDHPLRQLCFFAVIVGAFVAAELLLNPSPATQADAIVNVIIIPACSLTLGWYNCGLKLLAFDAERRLQLLSAEDPGTGLGNRRCLFADLQELCDSRKIQGLFMIDVDNFKEYNDCYGHLMGDRCLKKIADLLQGYGDAHGVRFYRFGGDEFVGLHHTVSGVNTDVAAAELLELVNAAAIDFSKWQGSIVTISVGYTDTAPCGVEECIRKADEALYRAKRSGKNAAAPFLPPEDAGSSAAHTSV